MVAFSKYNSLSQPNVLWVADATLAATASGTMRVFGDAWFNYQAGLVYLLGLSWFKWTGGITQEIVMNNNQANLVNIVLAPLLKFESLIIPQEYCPLGYPYYFAPDNLCYDACPLGFAADAVLMTCVACPSGCAFCSSVSVCLSCKSPNYLDNSGCVGSCPSGTFADALSRTCAACP